MPEQPERKLRVSDVVFVDTNPESEEVQIGIKSELEKLLVQSKADTVG